MLSSSIGSIATRHMAERVILRFAKNSFLINHFSTRFISKSTKNYPTMCVELFIYESPLKIISYLFSPFPYPFFDICLT